MPPPTKAIKGTREQQNEAVEPATLQFSDSEAKELFELALSVKQLAPWKWMADTDLNFLICKRPSRNESTWRNQTAI